MGTPLLSTLDRVLQERARANAAAGLRDSKLHTAQRQEAEQALPSRLPAAARQKR
jgi:hypothetical protein